MEATTTTQFTVRTLVCDGCGRAFEDTTLRLRRRRFCAPACSKRRGTWSGAAFRKGNGA